MNTKMDTRMDNGTRSLTAIVRPCGRQAGMWFWRVTSSVALADGQPVKHATGVLMTQHLSLPQAIVKSGRSDTEQMAWNDAMHIMREANDDAGVVPPWVKAAQAEADESALKAVDDTPLRRVLRNGVRYRCGTCHEEGHNRRTCPQVCGCCGLLVRGIKARHEQRRVDA